ncbi:hypothetical protein [Jannaschia pohangensis]|nr:hypothetical protein [Jannaschia pohangensis]
MNEGLMEVTRTETGGRVKITKTVSYEYINGADPNIAAGANYVSWAVNELNAGARMYRVELNQPGCKTQTLSILFELKPVASGGNAVIKFDGTPNTPGTNTRSYVLDGNEMVFFLNGDGDPKEVMLHEVYHLFGQPDEYSELPGIGSPPSAGGVVTYSPPTPGPMEVTYIGTATQGDTPISLSYFGPTPHDPAMFLWNVPSSLMGDGSLAYYGESFFWIAIEMEKIFATEGTPVTAKIVLP